MAQLMPLPLTDSCFSKIQIGFTFLVPAHPGSPGKRATKRVCVCVCMCVTPLTYLYVVCSQPELCLFQKLKLLQKSGGGGGQPTVDNRSDSEMALTRLAPEGASSTSVSLCS